VPQQYRRTCNLCARKTSRGLVLERVAKKPMQGQERRLTKKRLSEELEIVGREPIEWVEGFGRVKSPRKRVESE